MARPRSETLTPREAEIMKILWDAGPATAEQIRAALTDKPHDSTVRTLLRVLVEKGHIASSKKGKAFVYQAAAGRAHAEGNALRNLLRRFFAGSAENLVLRLVEDEQLTPEQLEQLKKAACAKRSRGKGEPS